jgi:hypothetical protein
VPGVAASSRPDRLLAGRSPWPTHLPLANSCVGVFRSATALTAEGAAPLRPLLSFARGAAPDGPIAADQNDLKANIGRVMRLIAL